MQKWGNLKQIICSEPLFFTDDLYEALAIYGIQDYDHAQVKISELLSRYDIELSRTTALSSYSRGERTIIFCCIIIFILVEFGNADNHTINMVDTWHSVSSHNKSALLLDFEAIGLHVDK